MISANLIDYSSYRKHTKHCNQSVYKMRVCSCPTTAITGRRQPILYGNPKTLYGGPVDRLVGLIFWKLFYNMENKIAPKDICKPPCVIFFLNTYITTVAKINHTKRIHFSTIPEDVDNINTYIDKYEKTNSSVIVIFFIV